MGEEALVGRTIGGKYAIESFVGGGGMGSVYRARQIGLDKLVAVKILHAEFAEEASFVTRFKREAKAASRIDHPNSMRVLDFGQEPDGLLYIVMEYLAGRSLFDIFRAEAPLAPERIIDLFRQALAALAAAHDMGIVHRDLKPDNVLVLQRTRDEGTSGEHVKVCDFGIAKFTGNAQTTAVEKLTAAGTIIGTPDYLSPEQARSDDIDARSDIYSMGVILYEALTGQTPFHADSPLGIVLQHLDAEPIKPSELLPGVDPKLEAICLRCMKKKPEERYASAREMRAALAPESIRPSALPAAYASAAIPRAARAPVIAVTPAAAQKTPPPVSSTPAPVPLTRPKPQTPEPRRRPRLAELAAMPEPSAAPGIMFALLTVLATGAVGYWLYAGSSRVRAPVARATARASASAPVAALAEETIDAGVSFAASPGPSAPPAAASGNRARPASPSRASARGLASAAASAAAPPSAGRVTVGIVRALGVAASDVVAALPGIAIADCYRDGQKPDPFTGTATLHFEFANGQARTTFRAEGPLARIGACVENAANGVVVKGGGDAKGDADVDLRFGP